MLQDGGVAVCLEAVLHRQRRRGDRHDHLGEEQPTRLPGEGAVAHADRRVVLAVDELVVTIEQAQAELPFAERVAQPVDPRHEPLLRDARVGGEHERVAAARQLGEAALDGVEAGRDVAPQPPAGVGELAPVRGAGEQLGAERALEGADLARHRGLAEVELDCGSGEAAEPGRGVEDHEPLETLDVADELSHPADRSMF